MSYPSTILAGNPTAFWRLNEPAGTPTPTATVADSAGSATGTVVGTVTLGGTAILAGDSGTSASQSAGENGIQFAVPAGFGVGAGDFTFEAWVKFTDSGNDVFFSFNGIYFNFFAGKLSTSMWGDLGASRLVNDGASHHCLWMRRAGNARHYVDGVLVGTPAANSTSLGASGNGQIGRNNPGGYNFVGSYSDLAFYPRALTDAEATSHYNTGSATSTAATGYTLSVSSSTVAVGSPITVTVTTTPAGSTFSTSGVVTIVDSGTSTGTKTITLALGASSGSTTLTPTAGGTHNLTTSHTGLGFSGGDPTASFSATSSSGLTISPTSLAASRLEYPIQLTPSGYTYSSAPTITITGGSGASAVTVNTAGLLILIPGTIAGALTISDGTSSATLTVTSANPVFIAPNDPNFIVDGRAYVTPTLVKAAYNNLKIRFAFAADSVKFGMDLTGITSPPELRIKVDGVALPRFAKESIAANPTITITPAYTSSTAVASSDHIVEVMVVGIQAGDPNFFQCLGLEMPAGSTLLPLSVNPNRLAYYSDSTGVGVLMLQTAANLPNDQSLMDGNITHPQILANRLGLELDLLAQGGATDASLASLVPYSCDSNAYAPPYPAAVAVVSLGYNSITASAYASLLRLIRTAHPNALIVCEAQPLRTSDLAIIQTAITATGDTNTISFDYSSGVISSGNYQYGGVHPGPGGHAQWGLREATDIQAYLTSHSIKYQKATGSSGGAYPAPADVRLAVAYGSSQTGTLHVPSASQVLATVAVDATVGNVILPTAAQVQTGVTFGPGSSTTGTYGGSGSGSGSGVTLAQLNAALASGITTLAPTAFDGIVIETGYSAKQAMKVGLNADANRITGNGTSTVTVAGQAMPTPTTGLYTGITATMSGTDRASTTIQLSTT